MRAQLLPVFKDAAVTVYHDDCIDVMPSLPAGSVQAVVTDPPYGIGFMGKGWDMPSPGWKTGFAGRQDLRLPRCGDSHNATCRACGGRQRGPKRCRCENPQWDRPPLATSVMYQQWCERWARECLRLLTPGGHLVAFGGTRTWHRLAAGLEDAGFEIRDSIAWLYGNGFPKGLDVGKESGRGADTIWRRWQGWNTGLKPAFEPIIVARKPLAGTVAGTVQRFGTGALHINVCRVPVGARPLRIGFGRDTPGKATFGHNGPGGGSHAAGLTDLGRWPPNVVMTHDARCRAACVYSCPVAVLNAQSGTLRRGANPVRRRANVFRDCYGHFTGSANCRPVRGADSGGALLPRIPLASKSAPSRTAASRRADPSDRQAAGADALARPLGDAGRRYRA